MENTYNGKPIERCLLKTNASKEALCEARSSMGLSMSEIQFLHLMKLLAKTSPSVPSAEIYTADALIKKEKHSCANAKISVFGSNEKIPSLSFKDLNDKRKALEDRGEISLSSLIKVYNKYLIETGYDDGKKDRIAVLPKTNDIDTQDSMKAEPEGKLSTVNFIPYAIGKAKRDRMLNRDKKRIPAVSSSSDALSVILIRVPNFPLEYEKLAEAVETRPRLSSAVRYIAPIGKAGLVSSLLGFECGFRIKCETVFELFDELSHPYMLTEPMCGAVVLVSRFAENAFIGELENLGIPAKVIGKSTSDSNIFWFDYENTVCKINPKLIGEVSGFTADFTTSKPYEECFGKTFRKESLSMVAFTGENSEKIYSLIKEEIERFEGKSLLAVLILPDNGSALPRFLSAYKALAENAIPIRRAVFSKTDDPYFTVCLLERKEF